MFSAIKRFASKGDGSLATSNVLSKPPGHQAMSTSLQRKFAKGVQYNMKIVIKGDRNVGKTCLFHRLQGKKFMEEYIPTEEIQVASIQWNYKATDDIVKVEVWDVVDRGKKKKRFEGLKLDNSQMELPEETALDAEFLDVYKGTNGVIMMMDLTKTWTFDYVQRELPKVPPHIPVIVLANHCDMAHHRTVTSDHVTYYIESISGTRSAQVRYSESSMRNGFGLKFLHKFFNLPFLQLQREGLLGQLERNEMETTATIQELDIYCDSDEANYHKFLDTLVKKRRDIADSNANINMVPQTMRSSISSQQLGGGGNQVQTDVKRSQSGPIVIGAGKPIPYGNNILNQTSKKNSTSFISKSTNQISGLVPKTEVAVECMPDLRTLEISPITSVDEFCPDGGQLDRSFLEDVQCSTQSSVKVEHNESDSDTDTGNPLVSELQEDFEPEEVHMIGAKNNVNPDNKVINPVTKIIKSENSELDQDKTVPEEYDMKQTNDEFDATINSEISELTTDAFDTWMAVDTKWRRSPEGGEDISGVSQTLDYSNSTAYDDSTSVTSSNVHMELLCSKRSCSPINHSPNSDSEETPTSGSIKKEKKKKDKDKGEKKTKGKKTKTKDKDKDKHKEITKQEKKHKRRSRDESSMHKDELEEFLNGSSSPLNIDGAYEAI